MRGGKRPGSGRKKGAIAPEEIRKSITVSLPVRLIASLRATGRVSGTIEDAITNHEISFKSTNQKRGCEMVYTIHETKNYRMFELLTNNRDAKKIGKLVDSMKKHGFIEAYPLHVYQTDDGKMIIKAGHHRFKAAMHLGIPVKYVITNDNATVYELEEGGVGNWTMEDYFNSYCKSRLYDYLAVKVYMEKTGIRLGCAIAMLGGQAASSSGNFRERFKSGTYKITKDQWHADVVASIVIAARKAGIFFYNNSNFVMAISKAVFVSAFSPVHFIKKIKKNNNLFHPQKGPVEYLQLIENIYNYREKNPIPLVFLANEAAKARNFATSSKKQQ